MVCDGLSSPMGCCDEYIGSTPWIGEQKWEAWSIDHQILWIQVRYTRMVWILQFAPSTLFALERTCKYTQACAIYRWGKTQFHYSSTLECLFVGSNGDQVGQPFLLGKEIRSCVIQNCPLHNPAKQRSLVCGDLSKDNCHYSIQDSVVIIEHGEDTWLEQGVGTRGGA